MSKERLSKYADKLIIIFGRITAAGFKLNAPNSSFGLKKIPYLTQLITWKGIKPDPDKLQVIMNIGRNSSNSEA